MNELRPLRRVASTSAQPSPVHGSGPALALGALGVVFGDIGTSPLYAIDQIFFGPAGGRADARRTCSARSGWRSGRITLIVAIKYAALCCAPKTTAKAASSRSTACCTNSRAQGARLLLWSLMLGAGLLFGDGMITPAISVLSAVEGLDVATPAFAPFVVPITLRSC